MARSHCHLALPASHRGHSWERFGFVVAEEKEQQGLERVQTVIRRNVGVEGKGESGQLFSLISYLQDTFK